jgi:hypothetical protein
MIQKKSRKKNFRRSTSLEAFPEPDAVHSVYSLAKTVSSSIIDGAADLVVDLRMQDNLHKRQVFLLLGH